jgi:SNF2 family DNA or RNA helicase
MTPMEIVEDRFTLPFPPYDYQREAINELAPKPKSGHYLAVGVGKTMTSTCCALYKFAMGEIDQAVVNMPPILMKQWERWLKSITDKKTGKPLSVNMFRGSPVQRSIMRLDYWFNLMTYNIFKTEFDRITMECEASRTALIDDEASAIKNIASANYKATRNFSLDGHLMLLTGTPISKPEDAYAYIKLIAPHIYRNKNHFNNMHIAEYDFFNNPVKYKNLDVLAENMKVNAVRILKEDVLTQLPKVTYTTLDYELSPQHMALYKKLVEEQLLELPDGGKIDATVTQRLWHSMQQIVMNFAHFSGDPTKVSTGFDVVDETLEQLNGAKCLIFTNYRLTSAAVLAHTRKKYKSVALYGGMTPQQQDKAVDQFLADPDTTTMIVQPQSGGLGWNPQYVCADELFMEAPTSPILWEQATGRVDRNGQTKPVQIRVAIAANTIQNHMFNILMKNDELANRVVRNRSDLRELLTGG